MVASTWITPGCVQFWRKKDVFTRPGSKAEKLKASKYFLLFSQQRTFIKGG